MSTKTAMFMIAENTSSFVDEQGLQEAKEFYADSKNIHKPLKMKMTFMEVDVKNQNGRIYKERPVLESHNKIQRLIKMRHLHGEYQHPLVDSSNPMRFSTVLGDNSAINITECVYDRKTKKVTGTIETLMNAKGKEYKDMILYNSVMPAVSLRALGSVTQRNGQKIIENNLRVVTYDAVTNPSFVNAVAERIITESEITGMITDLSENLQMVAESFEMDDLELINPSDNIQYDLNENTAIICTNGSCLKIFLEEHIRNEFKASFSSYLLD